MTSGSPPAFDRNTFCPFIGDTATTSAGLRKLALTYNESQQGKLEMERYRNATKVPKKPFDPRFRRARCMPTYENFTKSDTKVPSPFHHAKAFPKSTPMVSSMPSSPKRSPHKKSKISLPRPVALDRAKTFRRMHSFVDRINKNDMATKGEEVDAVDKGEQCVNSVDAKDVVNLSMHVKYSPLQKSCDSGRVLDMYLSPPLEIKSTMSEMMSKSVLTIPQIASARRNVCVNCVQDKHSTHCNTSITGTNTLIQALVYASKMQAKKSAQTSWYIMWCLYGLGCLCGLILVSCLAWIISSDTLWHWVKPIKAPPEKAYTFYDLILTCGAGLIYSVNLVVNTVYNIISLPRNSVFQENDSGFSS